MSNRNNSDSCDDSEKRYFLNPESVSLHLFCSICQEVFSDPQRAPCGHSFCKKCIVQWLSRSKTCPDDRKPLKQENLHHDFILENIIGDQKVACTFRRKGCKHVGPLSRSASHKRECCFNPSNLPDFLRQPDEQAEPAFAEESANDADDPDLPTPARPSLKMRLFQAGGVKRELLCSAFENSSSSSSAETQKMKRLRKYLDEDD